MSQSRRASGTGDDKRFTKKILLSDDSIEITGSEAICLSPPSYNNGYNNDAVDLDDVDVVPDNGVQKNTDPVQPVVVESLDRSPHQLFVELGDLVTNSEDGINHRYEWMQMARWIKFEENILGDSNKWSQPHVASLSFQSLLSLHRALETGLMILDLEVEDNPVALFEKLADQLVTVGQLNPEQRGLLLSALLNKHNHGPHKAKVTKRASIDYGKSDAGNGSSGHRLTIRNGVYVTRDRNDAVHVEEGRAEEKPCIESNLGEVKECNKELLKKIPVNSETAVILCGTLAKLDRPVTAFIRLKHGEVLTNLAEVPLPVRFVFVCIGPEETNLPYMEIGLSLGTLLSNQSFQSSVYSALDRQHLLEGMNTFLSESLVLPPGQYDKHNLMPIMATARQKQKDLEAQKKRNETSIDDKAVEGDNREEDDPLTRTGRPFGGLVKDVKKRYSLYLSDFKDACSFQVLATIIFIYFAAVSPAITFGGLLSDKVDGYMGASELLLGTTIGGVIYSLFSGQPLLIVGFTGPLMVFEEGVFNFARDNNIDYLSWRLWVGLWIAVIALVHVATEASFIVKYVSRFTQEIFAFLISLIFIYETFAKLYKIFKEHPLCWNYEDCLEKTGRVFAYLPRDSSYTSAPSQYSNNSSSLSATNSTTVMPATADFNATTVRSGQTTISVDFQVHPNTALLSLTLTLFTFTLAYYMKGLRNEKILGRTIRRALGDFGVPIAIFVMVLVDFLIGDDVYTQKLQVPPKFSPTRPELRGWFINPLGEEKPLPIYHIFSAIIPALLGSILIFMETLITGMIINKAEHKLQKGTGFHLDILLMGLFAAISGVMALPIMTCATVRSVSHTSALTVISKNNAPGEHPKLEKVIEQRVSNLCVHVLMGASMFAGVVLSYIPMAVLFGVFLYMGVASLGGIQLYIRLLLYITPAKHHPHEFGFVSHVRKWKMHLFTLIQLLCVGLLWGVKSSPGALAFPFILLLLLPLRAFFLKYIFSVDELSNLDCREGNSESKSDNPGEEDEPDFYEIAHMPD